MLGGMCCGKTDCGKDAQVWGGVVEIWCSVQGVLNVHCGDVLHN